MLINKNEKGGTVLQAAILVTLLLGIGMAGYYFFYFAPSRVMKVDIKPTLSEASTKAPATQVPTSTNPDPKPTVQEVNIGMPFSFHSFTITVTSASNIGSKIGSKYTIRETEGQFVIINFSAKNDGPNAETLSTLALFNESNALVARVQDSMRRNYDSDSSTLFGLLSPDVTESIGYVGSLNSFSKIKPGFGTDFSLVYEVATDSKGMSVLIGTSKELVAVIPLGF